MYIRRRCKCRTSCITIYCNRTICTTAAASPYFSFLHGKKIQSTIQIVWIAHTIWNEQLKRFWVPQSPPLPFSPVSPTCTHRFGSSGCSSWKIPNSRRMRKHRSVFLSCDRRTLCMGCPESDLGDAKMSVGQHSKSRFSQDRSKWMKYDGKSWWFIHAFEFIQ